MTAAKKLKATPKPAAKKRTRAPVVKQAAKTAATRKVPVSKAVKAKQVAQVDQVIPIAQPAGLEVSAPLEPVAQVVPADAEANKMTANPADVSDGSERILLPARMELASLDEAQQLLQSKYPPVQARYILDGALLSVIDMAGIQMLISFIRSVTERGTRIEWDNYSVQVYQLASELGVTSQLGD